VDGSSSSWGRFVGADEVRVLLESLDVRGKAVQADPIKPTLKAPETKRLKL
jgi:hypothetical protein